MHRHWPVLARSLHAVVMYAERARYCANAATNHVVVSVATYVLRCQEDAAGAADELAFLKRCGYDDFFNETEVNRDGRSRT